MTNWPQHKLTFHHMACYKEPAWVRPSSCHPVIPTTILTSLAAPMAMEKAVPTLPLTTTTTKMMGLLAQLMGHWFSVKLSSHRRKVHYFPIITDVLSPNWFFSLASKYPYASFQVLREHVGQVNLNDLVWYFLFYQQHPTFTRTPLLSLCPTTENIENISVFHSATAVFCAPSNLSGIGSLYCETIWSTPRWQTSGMIVSS